MRTRITPLVEVKVFFAAEDELPVVPERKDGADSGFRIAVDIIEAQFAFDDEDVPVVLSGRVRGFRVNGAGDGLSYTDGQLHWMDLIAARIPDSLNIFVGQMKTDARKKWKAIKEAK
jgi:hypothetical protein